MGTQDDGRQKQAANPIETYRRFWKGTLDRLEEHLRNMEIIKTKSQTNCSGKKRPKHGLDR